MWPDFRSTIPVYLLLDLSILPVYPLAHVGRKHRKLRKDPKFLVGKLTLSMAMFYSYVTKYQSVPLPETGRNMEELPKELIAGSRPCALPTLSPALSLVNERVN